MQTDAVSIHLEFTPNPNTLKFTVNRSLIPQGAVNFTHPDQANQSPLAKELFTVSGVQAVMIGPSFVTITKAPDGDWDVLADQVPAKLQAHLESGNPVLSADFQPQSAAVDSGSDIERRIREVLDNEIRPAVAMDGGDITFSRYEDGVVYLELRGSCSSCAHSSATLKMGVETRLKEVIPEIKEVVEV